MQECQGLRQKCHTKEAECRELTQQWGRALGRAAIARAESKAKDSLLEAEKTRSNKIAIHTHYNVTLMSSQGEIRNRPSEETIFQIQSRLAGKSGFCRYLGMCCGIIMVLPVAQV